MQPNEARLIRALAREGLGVSHAGDTYTVRLLASPEAPEARVLLPPSLPIESKGLHQIANLAATTHPYGGSVTRAVATPDFHPGDGIAIGSVMEMKDMLIPAGVGGDINCGMRLHVMDLPLDTFMAGKNRLVELLKGDYFLGTRDIPMTPGAMWALFEYGVPYWLQALKDEGTHGHMTLADLGQLKQELGRVFHEGSFWGDPHWAPQSLTRDGDLIRDGGLATIGGGNHFVEIQEVMEVLDRSWAHAWGVREGQMAFMIHSGSRIVGKNIGTSWKDIARNAWPKGTPYPESGIFPVVMTPERDYIGDYLRAEGAAVNYGFVNRLLLAEIMRWRLREVFGPLVAPLVYDIPHNITLSEGGKWVTRKGSCPAHAGQPVIIPGSMGTASYLMVGLGNDTWISSASHGAGRAHSRFQMGRRGSKVEHGLEGVDCITLREERKIEEAPSAYKPIQPVVDVQVKAGTVSPVARLRPVLTFKA